jgi:hypothetical protein
MAAQWWQKRHCFKCKARLNYSDDFIKIVLNKWTVSGVSKKQISCYCVKCAKKKGLIDEV